MGHGASMRAGYIQVNGKITRNLPPPKKAWEIDTDSTFPLPGQYCSGYHGGNTAPGPICIVVFITRPIMQYAPYLYVLRILLQ